MDTAKAASVALVQELHDSFAERLVKLEQAKPSGGDATGLAQALSSVMQLIEQRFLEFRSQQEKQEELSEARLLSKVEGFMTTVVTAMTTQAVADRKAMMQMLQECMDCMKAPKTKTGVIDLPEGQVKISISESTS